MWWAMWWTWIIVALGFGIAEVILPSYVFLGFAIGALITGLMLLVGGPVAVWMTASGATLLLVFAVLSLVAWLGLRRALGVRQGQVKIIDTDVNDN